ncbi:9699_t:CDS:2 [Ambispora gerdemannii]|uniref:Meiotic nuclear division protein 1 n=1 Tax=Ambispora gerdemannii TaxID=144530 RepID=A0A9N8V884_9GLOM|nr:9699_t:CDS:2 [Ambispora gerdemannii]
MPPKGLSAAEKRRRLEELFHETKEFYQLKELEKIAPKQKGIVMQSVKDVLQSLIDDNLVATDRIGTSNYFWSFPSSALQSRKAKIDELTHELEKLKEKKSEIQLNIEKAKGGREESDDREELLKKLAEAKTLKKQNTDELQRYRECDPTLLEAKEKAAKCALESANRWTDNIFQLQTYICDKFFMPREDFYSRFGIPEDLDTIEN